MKRFIVDTHAFSCHFRTSVGDDARKALMRITDRSDLHYADCEWLLAPSKG